MASIRTDMTSLRSGIAIMRCGSLSVYGSFFGRERSDSARSAPR